MTPYLHSSIQRSRRQRRVRAGIRGTAERPRLSVFRSNRYLSAQLIDDAAGVTLAAASERELRPARAKAETGQAQRASLVGQEIASRAIAKGITAVRFDRGRYRYHGLVAALAAGARKGGLKF
ncbi:MAG: 50S ribosomal protein L18 [Candidatus Sungbacteria bacterium]|uniref:Large ribosomal subunit protein uL18 n=1 Tax=Candidatus Sungiibacteriota bacterium TaxID=2750080 RepID=A0A932YVB8_9BACT|nr:50S ribosomal protein L18 [Candidatus Sungbacteria bacterium]